MRVGKSLYFMSKALGVLALVGMLASGAWAGQGTFVLYSFSGSNDGGNPASALTFDSAGNAYGTTVSGGDFGFGTVFQLSPIRGGWSETVLYSFTGFFDGKNPHGGVTIDKDGNLYGTTVAGGDGFCTGDGCGVVFKLANSGGVWTQSVIHSFTDDNKGFGPGGQVVFDKAGNLYGTTPDGGKGGVGTVYKLAPTKNGNWKHTVIHHFTGGRDGGVGSLGSLLVKGGNLYGVTEIGGENSAGTAFKMTPNPDGTWKLRTLYAFKGMPDAGFPYGGLISDAKGRLYGTTYYGGANGVGSVYRLSNQGGTWQEEVLYSFAGGKDGSLTTTTLVFDKSGNLFGTTSEGGNQGCSCGTIFKLKSTKSGWVEKVAHRFSSVPDGAYSYYGLSYNGVDSFYGTSNFGGVHNQGTVFQFVP